MYVVSTKTCMDIDGIEGKIQLTSVPGKCCQLPRSNTCAIQATFLCTIMYFCTPNSSIWLGAGANALSSLVLQCVWESFALPVIVTPLVQALTADQPAEPSQSLPGIFSTVPQSSPGLSARGTNIIESYEIHVIRCQPVAQW